MRLLPADVLKGAFFDFAGGKTHVLWPLEKKGGIEFEFVGRPQVKFLYIQDQFAESNLMLVGNIQ